MQLQRNYKHLVNHRALHFKELIIKKKTAEKDNIMNVKNFFHAVSQNLDIVM